MLIAVQRRVIQSACSRKTNVWEYGRTLFSIKMEWVDIEKFISLIKSRPSIWNHTSTEYCDKIKRNNDWMSVCEEFVPNFAEKSNKEKSATATELQNKWKVLRDGFTRSLRNHSKKSGKAGTLKLYKYHVQLLFLKDVLVTKGKHKISAAGSSHTQSETPPVEIFLKRQKHDTKEMSSNDLLIEKLTKNVIKRFNNDENDEDKQFLLCLLKDFKRIPDDYKLDAKSDIINIIRHYTSKSSNQYRTESAHSQDSHDDKFNVGTTHRPYRPQTVRQSISSPETSTESKIAIG